MADSSAIFKRRSVDRLGPDIRDLRAWQLARLSLVRFVLWNGFHRVQETFFRAKLFSSQKMQGLSGIPAALPHRTTINVSQSGKALYQMAMEKYEASVQWQDRDCPKLLKKKNL
jgi:hypothetical protein